MLLKVFYFFSIALTKVRANSAVRACALVIMVGQRASGLWTKRKVDILSGNMQIITYKSLSLCIGKENCACHPYWIVRRFVQCYTRSLLLIPIVAYNGVVRLLLSLITKLTMAQVWVYVNGHITDVVNSDDSLHGDRTEVVVCRPSIKFPNGESLNKVCVCFCIWCLQQKFQGCEQ